MKKTTLILLVTLVLMTIQNLLSQTNVTFVNTGKMKVAAHSLNTRVSLYVPDAMRQLAVAGRDVEIIQNGITELGGNFYHDALTNIFVVDASTKTTSTGKFRFVKEHPGVNRTINTQSKNINTFNRGLHYIAFPNIEISTNDSIAVPGKMGIDAISLHRVNAKTGKLILRSNVVGQNSYDASLRITQGGLSASLVDLGAVVVERDMSLYRPNDGSTQMFAFATPYKNTQLSGYYAGNWVRRPQNTGTYGHTTYIYGDKDADMDNVIDADQYISLAAEKLVPTQAYLIKPRPKGYDYSNLKSENGLWYTGEPNPSLYDKGKYYFNGKVYTVSPYSEQLFADDVIFSNSISTPNLGSTVNWLIGNSYTCPIPTSLIAQQMASSSLEFSPYIYVYPAGSTTYQACDISGSGQAIQVANVDEIPAMSVFMVRVSRNKAQNGSLNIGKDLLRHADVAHNTPMSVKGSAKAKSAVGVTNQVIFRVSPVNNENIFDLAAIGLRDAATTGTDIFDMSKAYVNDKNLFQLYTLSSTQSKLSANGMPLTTDSVIMAFKPSNIAGDYKLNASYVETLEKEGLWLYDLKTKEAVDMKSKQDYFFSAMPTDFPERFIVSFKTPNAQTSLHEITYKLDLFYTDLKVRVLSLTAADVNSKIIIYDMQGKQLLNTKVTNYPEMTIPVDNIMPGVYLVQLKGERTAIAKFIKN